MKIVKIPKRNGKYRTIYIPGKWKKLKLAKHRHYLDWLYLKMGIPDCVHGFIVGRSAVTNAKAHVGYQHTVSIDLFSFFDTIRRRHLRAIPREVLKDVLVRGAPRQGLCTSPVVSNIALFNFDQMMMTEAKRLKIVYTRYADDITMSGNDIRKLRRLFNSTIRWIERTGFYVEKRKTKWQHAKGGRRMITGVAVDDKGVYTNRKFRRRLRAARHQGNLTSAQGMEEWASMKTPTQAGNTKAIVVKGRPKFETTTGKVISRTNTFKGSIAGNRKKIANRVAQSLSE